jgi:deoxyribose-phosphate aldolase
MRITANDVANMMDLSCVKTFTTLHDVNELLDMAQKYSFGQVSVLQCHLAHCVETLKDRKDIKVVGNMSFPSGSDSTEMKVVQTKQMLDVGCTELDVVMNVGMFLSKEYDFVLKDLKAVVKTVDKKVPLKVIIEVGYLTEEQVKKASEICLASGADFVKTGTGWSGATTIKQIEIIKAVVGEKMLIKASGGVRTPEDFANMMRAGANRIGINLKSGISIVEACQASGGLEV